MSIPFVEKNNVLLSSFEEVRQICEPLERHFNINSFTYLKILPDLSRIHLDTNSAWSSFFYTKAEEYYKQYMSGGHHWETGYSPILALEDASLNDAVAHGLGEGVVLTQKCHDGSTELIYMAHDWKKHQGTKLDLLMSNIDLLGLFIDYFKERAEPLITEALKNPIVYPFLIKNELSKKPSFTMDIRKRFSQELSTIMRNTTVTPRNTLHLKALFNQERKRQVTDIYFLENGKLSLGHYYGFSILSVREALVLIHFLLGIKPKEVRHEMGIKKGTYDSMFDRIKKKMGCHTTSDIIHSAVRSGLMGLLVY